MSGKFVRREEFFSWMERERKRMVITERAWKQYASVFSSPLEVIRTVKMLLFPGWEEVYRYSLKERKWTVEEPQSFSLSSFLLFLLPCEAKAVVEVLDVNFLQGGAVDTQYAMRRNHVSLVVLGCQEVEETCFCSLVGCSPSARQKEGAFLFPWGEYFYLEDPRAILPPFWGEENQGETEKMEAFFAQKTTLLPPPLPQDFPHKLYRLFEDEKWKALTWHCINCGACTFLCPTCYCFDLTVDGKLRGSMLRTWDSCMFPKFTLHASSHNPRPTAKERVRQRVMHKFSYFPLRTTFYGCVGCGVCRKICPVNWDIKEVVERMVKHIEH